IIRNLAFKIGYREAGKSWADRFIKCQVTRSSRAYMYCSAQPRLASCQSLAYLSQVCAVAEWCRACHLTLGGRRLTLYLDRYRKIVSG
ncbi:uncharacterized protein K441DRAFT_531559, partial [Cenococcum geophilum 1.58]|uniref:uncharacterized protein n=1 Tax=Cenococcum geophilum 1.58 TaxID=794803 RepID=UPI00358F9485